jgi:hypothetical protein
MDDWGSFTGRRRDFLFSVTTRWALETTKFHIERVPRCLATEQGFGKGNRPLISI